MLRLRFIIVINIIEDEGIKMKDKNTAKSDSLSAGFVKNLTLNPLMRAETFLECSIGSFRFILLNLD